MPTVDAANHARTFGSDRRLRQAGVEHRRGSRRHRHRGVRRRRDAHRRLHRRARPDRRAPRDPQHLPPRRCARSSSWSRSRASAGCEKIMITHPFFKVPNLDLETLKQLVDQGAYAEFGYCTVSPMWGHAPLTKVVEAIRAVGPEHSILMSDAGQRHNPMPAEACACSRSRARVGHLRGRHGDRSSATTRSTLLERPLGRSAAGATAAGNGQAPTAGPPHTVGRAVSARVGLIVPSSNTVMEPDFYRRLPAGARSTPRGCSSRRPRPRRESVMLDEHVPTRCVDLGTARPDVVVFGCTSAGALRGNAYEAELIERISRGDRRGDGQRRRGGAGARSTARRRAAGRRRDPVHRQRSTTRSARASRPTACR